MSLNYSFMSFAKGAVSAEGGSSIKRYVGVAPVKVLAVNPSKEKLEEIYSTTIESEPSYISEKDGVKQARIDFVVRTDAEKCDGIELTSKVTFFISDKPRFNKDETKVQVIDKYGRTAWVTKEQAKAKEIPMYANGPANLDADYRPIYVGEEDLTNFIKTYLNIPAVMAYIDGKWVPNPKAHADECEARLSTIKEMFSGNFKEIKEIASYQPNNKVKVLFGVKTTDEGKQYQTIYTGMVLKNAVSDYSKLDAEIKERKSNGAFATTEYVVCPLKEYSVEPTDFSANNPAVEANKVETTNWFDE